MKGMILMGSAGKLQGKQQFCVSNNAFAIDGYQRCVSRGYRRAGFILANVNPKRKNLIELYEKGQASVSVTN